ncbi:MAG: acyl-CoA dehydrogenase family protein, partial [Hyphomicrobiaceae bacterium]
DSIERLMADRYADMTDRAAAQREPGGFGRETWRAFADLGLLAIPFAERHGGLERGAVETMLVCESIGRALALEPYLATVVLGGGILRYGGTEAQQSALIPQIVSGALTLALAHSERQSRYDLADVATTARRLPDGGWSIEGEKSVAIHGDSADKLIVSARVAGNRRDTGGIGLFLVDAKADGLTRRGYATQDGLRAADVTLAGVRAAPDDAIGTPGDGWPILARVVDDGIAALTAEAVGAMAALHALTVDYLKTRTQFGVPIGSFQVLQHRAVDMFAYLEQARSMALFATMMAAEPDPAERRKAMSAAKVQIGRSARFIGEQATQLHGGIGMTMEYKGGHYYKRLIVIDLMFGDADHHLRTLAQTGGLENRE